MATDARTAAAIHTPMMLRWWLQCLMLAAASSGCINILTSVATPTALERQLLGVYEALDRVLVLASSVRDHHLGAATPEPLRAQAIEARRRQRFNEDDIDELKAAGCLAEASEGTLTARQCAVVDEGPESQRRTLERVVQDENRSRRQIWAWAASVLAAREGRRTVTDADRVALGRTYHRLLREAAAVGSFFEIAPGTYRAVGR